MGLLSYDFCQGYPYTCSTGALRGVWQNIWGTTPPLLATTGIYLPPHASHPTPNQLKYNNTETPIIYIMENGLD